MQNIGMLLYIWELLPICIFVNLQLILTDMV